MVVFVILSILLVNLWHNNALCNWECGVGWEDERRMMNWEGSEKKADLANLMNIPATPEKTSTSPEQSKITLPL
jgi:hypothetical protein